MFASFDVAVHQPVLVFPSSVTFPRDLFEQSNFKSCEIELKIFPKLRAEAPNKN